MVIGTMTTASAQDFIMFQPSGGANDGTDEGTLMAGKDTWVNRATPTENKGGQEYFLASPRSTCNTSDYKAYIQFAVTDLPEVVDSVFFGVTHFPHETYCYSNCNADYYFYMCTSPWNEMELVQNNLPSEAGEPFYGPVNVTFPNNFGTVEYNITAAYQYWKDEQNPNYGFTIYSPTSGCNNASVGFSLHSSGAEVEAERPYLKVYTSPVGINEVITENNAYPNPFSDFIRLELNGADSYSIRDILGREMPTEYDASRGEILTQNLPSGIYLLEITSDKGSVVKRMVKR